MPMPTKLTPELQQRICETVACGNYREVAAQANGVDPRTLKRWVKWGREGRGLYAEFLAALLAAEKQAEMNLVRLVYECRDPKYALEFLGRRYPERWGSQRRELRELQREVRELAALLGARGITRPDDDDGGAA